MPAQRGYKVRALTRSAEKARELLGDRDGLQVVIADARQPETLQSVTDGVAAVAAVTGTTAFPSKRCAYSPVCHRACWIMLLIVLSTLHASFRQGS
jgi:hypothetical protein